MLAMVQDSNRAFYKLGRIMKLGPIDRKAQKTLLIALADDPEELPFSKDFQLRYRIGPASSIQASLASLLKKGIVYKTFEGRYRFVDRFMPYWIDNIRN